MCLLFLFLCLFQLRLIVDTGSTTLAVASYSRVANDEYFDTSKSKSLSDSDRQVS